MKLETARNIASKAAQTLIPHTEIVSIAGSIRREKPDVKDIEIVCLPNVEIIEVGIFNERVKVRSQSFKNQVVKLGTRRKGRPAGRYMQIELPEGINLGLFMPEAHDYYRQLAIRTGSAEWVRKHIAGGWKKKGWVGTPNGLRLKWECARRNGKWVIATNPATLPPLWKSEEDFFDWLGLKWVHPRDREI